MMNFQTLPRFMKGTCGISTTYKAVLVFAVCLSAVAFIVMFEYTFEYSRTNLNLNASTRTSFAPARHMNVIRVLTNTHPEQKQNLSASIIKLAKDKSKVTIKEIKPAIRFVSPVTTVGNITPKPKFAVTLEKDYILENPHLCSSVDNLSVLIIIHTAPAHFDRRQNIRRTYANATYFQPLGTLRVLFLLGRVKDPSVQDKIVTEFQQYGDILQGDFIDAYKNLTHKGVMAYKWIQERCRNTKVVLKADDDVIVNMYKIFTEHLPKFEQKSKSIFCNHIWPGTMLIIRDKKSKWFVNENEFKGKRFYPRYCSGFFVMMTNDMIPDIYKSAFVTPFFWVDDVYLYGLVPSKVKGISYTGLKPGSFNLGPVGALKCYRNSSRVCNYLVTGASKPEHVAEIWKHMTEQYLRTIPVKTYEITPDAKKDKYITTENDNNIIVKQLIGQEEVKRMSENEIRKQDVNVEVLPRNSNS